MRTQVTRMTESNVSAGARKAAIFVLTVGDEVARELFTRLSEDEIRYLGDVAQRLENVTPAEVAEVLLEFRQYFQGGHIPKKGVGGVFQLMIERALGEDRAKNLFSPKRRLDDPFELCNAIDTSLLAKLLENEHPQTTAVILDGIDPKRSSEVLAKFDAEMVPDIVYRMAHLKGVSEEVRQEIGDTFAAELRAMNLGQEEPESSDQKTVQVLKSMKPDVSKSVLESLEAVDIEFARELKAKLFTFDDLTALDSRSMQRLLRELDSKQLAVAMKGASDGISSLVFSSMSSRAADMLRDDIDAMGPVRLADVEAAQKSIVDAAMRLEEEGVLTLPRGGDDVL